MKNILLIAVSLFGLGICAVNAQTAGEFKPSGKPELTIFSNFHSSFADGQNASKFELARAYLGYSYSFSSTFSGRVTFEVGNPGVGNFQFTALLKNGYLHIRKTNLPPNLG